MSGWARLKISIIKNYKKEHGSLFCHYCGIELKEIPLDADKSKLKIFPLNMVTMDHFLPIKLGGKGTRNNIVMSCYECNHLKGDILIAHTNSKKIDLCEEYIKRKPQIANSPDFFKYVFNHIPKRRVQFITNYG